MRFPRRTAFTIVELLVVTGIIALLIAILVPAIGRARDGAKRSESEANLRNIGIAQNTYASEWNDRQLTHAVDDVVTYGLNPDGGGTTTAAAAGQAYRLKRSKDVPGIALGWGHDLNGVNRFWAFNFNPDFPTNWGLQAPYIFDQSDPKANLGWFRLLNAKALHDHLGGRFYDRIFYAPKDVIVLDHVEAALEAPWEYVATDAQQGPGLIPTIGYSSYVTSPAALFSPEVLGGPSSGGYHDPWSLPAGLRCPSMSQARHPSLKTHVIEHHWLQGQRGGCNPAFAGGPTTYAECEPWYFNHAAESQPASLFYDGHVEAVGVRQAERADSRVAAQSDAGLWHRGTPLGVDGYFIQAAYDDANTSFHILTVDGILGRDVVSD